MDLKIRIKRSGVFRPLNTVVRAVKRLQWWLQGRPVPPLHEIKQDCLIELRNTYRPKVFVETGTYRGKMVFAMRPYFARVVSIELDPALADRAQGLFVGLPEVEVVRGDSAEFLPRILADLKVPALFWLDGHYSGSGTGKAGKDTPIMEELGAIFAHPVRNHVIAIDDAHCFNGEGDYPTLSRLGEFVAEHSTGYRMQVGENIIRITPV